MIDTRLAAEDYKKVRDRPSNETYEYNHKIYRGYDTLSFALLKDKIAQEQPVKRKQRLTQNSRQ